MEKKLEKGTMYTVSLNNGVFLPPCEYHCDVVIGGRSFAELKRPHKKTSIFVNYSYICSIDEESDVDEIFNTKEEENHE